MMLHCAAPFRVLTSCHCACGAVAAASHFVRLLSLHSGVQTTCLESAAHVLVAAIGGLRAAGSVAPPGRRQPESQRKAKAEGKIKGRGTAARGKRVCTWGGRGTAPKIAVCRECLRCRIGSGEVACHVRWIAMHLYGVAT